MPPNTDHVSRLESIAFYTLLGTIVLAPLAFWPTQYFALEAVKTIVLALGTIVSAALLLFKAFRDKKLSLPPRSIVWIGVLMAIALVISAMVSTHFGKSFFGQGFELGAGSLILLLMLASLVAYWAVSRRPERVIVIYAGIVASFLVLYVIHAIRLIAGPGFATLGILDNATSSILGGWYALAIYATVVTIIAISAILFLPLSSRLRTGYWTMTVLAAALAFLVNSSAIWQMTALVFLGLSVYLWIKNPRKSQDSTPSFWKRIYWVPLIAALISIVFAYKGTDLAKPVIDKLGVGYSEVSLPWQMTIDVAAAEFKQNLLFGTGSNRFGQAFLLNKPVGINPTAAWGIEFNAGFGLIPTFVVTQGLVGSILWVLFFVFYVILGIRSLRAAFARSDEPYARFAVVSSYSMSTFLWLIAIFYVPPHAIVYYAFILTGVWLGTAAVYGGLRTIELAPQAGSRSYRILPIITLILTILVILWGVTYIKNSTALAYFGRGVKAFTVTNDPVAADQSFQKAISLNGIDVYWQGRVEASLARARTLANSVTSDMDASTTQKIAADAALAANEALKHAEKAVVADPSNYYNYLSAARVAEVASSLRMEGSYQAGIEAYVAAIRWNPQNPAPYANLARFQAANNQLDAAVQTIGAALQVKNNYLDAVYLLAQIQTAKGNLPDAITASQFAVTLNPQAPLLRFQLGLLQYTSGDYASAAATLGEAVKLQSDYANAQYFLGLSYARLGRIDEAAVQFEQLFITNPDNKEIELILTNLRSGRSPFTGATPPITPTPEKRPTPPLPENGR